jgi:hypothetical protein
LYFFKFWPPYFPLWKMWRKWRHLDLRLWNILIKYCENSATYGKFMELDFKYANSDQKMALLSISIP